MRGAPISRLAGEGCRKESPEGAIRAGVGCMDVWVYMLGYHVRVTCVSRGRRCHVGTSPHHVPPRMASRTSHVPYGVTPWLPVSLQEVHCGLCSSPALFTSRLPAVLGPAPLDSGSPHAATLGVPTSRPRIATDSVGGSQRPLWDNRRSRRLGRLHRHPAGRTGTYALRHCPMTREGSLCTPRRPRHARRNTLECPHRFEPPSPIPIPPPHRNPAQHRPLHPHTRIILSFLCPARLSRPPLRPFLCAAPIFAAARPPHLLRRVGCAASFWNDCAGVRCAALQCPPPIISLLWCLRELPSAARRGISVFPRCVLCPACSVACAWLHVRVLCMSAGAHFTVALSRGGGIRGRGKLGSLHAHYYIYGGRVCCIVRIM